MLTAADIEELRLTYRTHFGEELDETDAWDMGRRLLAVHCVQLEIIARRHGVAVPKPHTNE